MSASGKILIIRGGAIGDFILTLPVFAALREQFPSAPLEVLAYSNVTPLAMAAGLVDHVRSIESRALAGFFARNGELDENLSDYFASFAIIISFLYDPDDIFKTNVGRCSKAQFIHGPHRPDEKRQLHATSVLLQPLERLAIFDPDPVPKLRISVGQASRLSSEPTTSSSSKSNSKQIDPNPRQVLSFSAFDSSAPVSRHTRHLPHWRQAGTTYFVTFRLGDSIPREKLNQWRAELAVWMRGNPEPWTAAQERDYSILFTDRFHEWLDAGYGSCRLRDPEVSAIVEQAVQYFDGKRYLIGNYVIMPNHVHLLVRPLDEWKLEQILHSWKSFTAHAINRLLSLQGLFWQDESFDHIVRNEQQLIRFANYIRNNPGKAQLLEPHYRLGCGRGGLEEARPIELRTSQNGLDVVELPDRRDACPTRTTIALHPGSGSEKKNWPEAKWAELLNWLAQNTDQNILLVGGEAEGDRLHRLARVLPPDRLELLQSRPLVEVALRLTNCNFFIGHDSGISHLAAAVGIRSLILWGGTVEAIWRPRGDHVTILREPVGLASLPTTRVIEEFQCLQGMS